MAGEGSQRGRAGRPSSDGDQGFLSAWASVTSDIQSGVQASATLQEDHLSQVYSLNLRFLKAFTQGTFFGQQPGF